MGDLDHVSRKIKWSFHDSRKNKIGIPRFTEKNKNVFL